MKIGILGTRGIPNFYGGFEQFAEYFAEYLSNKNNIEVYVYSSNDHPYKEKKWKNVHLIHIPDPEDRIGTPGQFLYDLFCILDSRKRNFDIILQLGYTSNSIWFRLLPSKSIVITNMDGLEWKRSKYPFFVRKYLLIAERWAALYSDLLIADSVGIQKYLYSRYKKSSIYIPYGAHSFVSPNKEILTKYSLEPYNYNLIIARLEPENNIEAVLEGVLMSKNPLKIGVVGNSNTKYGLYLRRKYQNDYRIQFLGGIYNKEHLNNIRYFSNIYFHGHSVGGTNPSLLEAMATNCLICAHKNIFNSSILQNDAFYFEDYVEVSKLLDQNIEKANFSEFILNNINKTQNNYSWDKIFKSYEEVFTNIINEK